MINERQEPIYSAQCDVCKTDFEHSFEGWTSFMNRDMMTERMVDQEWYFGDGEQGEDGKHYCPDCYHIDEEDNFNLNQ